MTVRRWFAIHRRGRLLNAIVGRDSLLALKPAPEMTSRALDRCAIPVKDSAFVGDAESDYLAVARLGMEFFGVAFNQDLRHRLAAAGAGQIFSSPAALGIHLNLVDSAVLATGNNAEARSSDRS